MSIYSFQFSSWNGNNSYHYNLLFSGCLWFFCDPMDCSLPLSMRFPRRECWVGSHFLLLVIFLTQGSSPTNVSSTIVKLWNIQKYVKHSSWLSEFLWGIKYTDMWRNVRYCFLIKYLNVWYRPWITSEARDKCLFLQKNNSCASITKWYWF